MLNICPFGTMCGFVHWPRSKAARVFPSLFFFSPPFFLENSSIYHLLRFITLAVQPQAYSSFVVCVYLARTRAPYCTGAGTCTHCHQFDESSHFFTFFSLFYFSLLFFEGVAPQSCSRIARTVRLGSRPDEKNSASSMRESPGIFYLASPCEASGGATSSRPLCQSWTRAKRKWRRSCCQCWCPSPVRSPVSWRRPGWYGRAGRKLWPETGNAAQRPPEWSAYWKTIVVLFLPPAPLPLLPPLPLYRHWRCRASRLWSQRRKQLWQRVRWRQLWRRQRLQFRRRWLWNQSCPKNRYKK